MCIRITDIIPREFHLAKLGSIMVRRSSARGYTRARTNRGDMDHAQERQTPVPSASQKTLGVLEAALLHERFTDIVDASGLPKSTVHRILASLVDEGFIAGDAERGYRAGARFMTLAGRALSALDISQLAQPVVDALVVLTRIVVDIGETSGVELELSRFRLESTEVSRVPR